MISNSAKEEGGAIKWTYFSPSLSRVLFSNNTAIYGKDLAAYPIIFRVRFYKKGI